MKLKKIALALSVAAFGSQVQASGFQLFEQSGSGQGRAFAGMGAASDDASVQWYNAAGLTAIEGHQIVAGAHYINPSAKFSNSGSTGIFATGTDDNGGQSAVVPNLFWKGRWGAHDLGLSVVTPFGLETRYDSDWRGKYLGTKSDLKSININPSIARKVGKWSFGAGLNVQYMDATLKKRIYPATVLQALGYSAAQAAALGDGMSELSGNGWAWGYNLGVRYESDRLGTFGLAYRSTVDQTLKGDVSLYTLTGVLASRTPAQAKLTVPAVVDLSWSRAYGDRLTLLASATWTGWSSFKELRVTSEQDGSTLSYTPENWHDTWRFALGANYRLNGQWLLRGGVAYDQTPVSDAYRTVRIPDNDRRWLSLGVRYEASPTLKVDAAYSHLFTDTTPLNEQPYASTGQPLGLATGYLKGEYNSSVDIFSLQLVWNY